MFLCLFVSHFQDCSHCHDIFSHYHLLFVQCFNACQFCWLSSAPNCVAYFHINLDDLMIVITPKSVPIPDSFLWLWFLDRLLVFFLFISIVTSFCFLHILPGAILVTIYFISGLCALLDCVGVSFRTHLLHPAWVEASFEVLVVYSVE